RLQHPPTSPLHTLSLHDALPILTKQRKPDAVSPAKPNPEVQAKLAEAYGTLPLSFEANRGQADRNVKFLSRSHGGTWFLTPTEADRKSTRLNSSHVSISYAVFCL